MTVALQSVTATTLGESAAVLDTLAAVEPLFWTPFYNRARLYRGRPRPETPEVIVDVTKDCPFDCSFCFASETLDSGRRMTPDLLRSLATELAGVPRLTLVGGEPLTHPQLRQVMAILAEAHPQIEIYSNALALPDDPQKRADWLRDRFADLPARITLTVAVDRYHQQQYGAQTYADKIDAMLQLANDPESPVDVRFNVTAENLSTAGYLVVERIERCLEALHPPLLHAFAAALRSGRADRLFQFNPIVRLGRAADAAGEYLQAEDALFEPQVVLAPTADDGAELLASLPATWMPEPPALLRHGTVAGDQLAATLRASFVHERLGTWLLPALAPAFDWLHAARHGRAEAGWLGELAAGRLARATNPQLAALQAAIDEDDTQGAAGILRVAAAATLAADWSQHADAWMERVADRLHALCRPGQGWSLAPERPHRRLIAPVLRRFLARHLAEMPVQGEALVACLADLATAAIADGAWPAYTGYREREGLITDPPESPLPLREVPLDMGVATPYFGDALVHPRLVGNLAVDAEGAIEFELDGLGAVPLGGEAEADVAVEGFQHLLGLLMWWLPEDLAETLDCQARDRLQAIEAASANGPLAAIVARRCLDVPPIAPPPPAEIGRSDLARLLLGKAHASLL